MVCDLKSTITDHSETIILFTCITDFVNLSSSTCVMHNSDYYSKNRKNIPLNVPEMKDCPGQIFLTTCKNREYLF